MWYGVCALFAAVLVVFAAACDRPLVAPAVCATWQAPDGTWMEEDNEPVDSDPCDRQPDYKPATVVPKLPVVRTPAVPQVPVVPPKKP